MRSLYFVNGVLSWDVVVELGDALSIEEEFSHFAFGFTGGVLVPIIIGAAQ